MTRKKLEESDYRQKFLGEEASRYEQKAYHSNSYYSLMWEIEKKYLEKFLNGRKFSNYLDFACGSGRVIEFVGSYANQSMGIDVSKDMLAIAKEKAPKARLIEQDITQESLKVDSKFDLVTAFRFFLNAQDHLREGALKEFARFTQDDAYVIVSNQGNKTPLRALAVYIERVFLKRKLNQMSKKELEGLFNTYGFELVDYRGVGVIPKAVYKVPVVKKLLYYIDLLLYHLKVFNWLSHTQILIFKKVK